MEVTVRTVSSSTGFISLDCGSLPNSTYTSEETGIKYISDSGYINTGNATSILPEFQKDTVQQLWRLRSFPDGVRNCYKFKLIEGNRYLIRTTFLYGNYDEQGILPVFDLYIGPNKWSTVKARNVSMVIVRELVHVVTSDPFQVCVVNTDSGIPFISALEIRPLASTIYQTVTGSLNLFQRTDVGSATEKTIR